MYRCPPLPIAYRNLFYKYGLFRLFFYVLRYYPSTSRKKVVLLKKRDPDVEISKSGIRRQEIHFLALNFEQLLLWSRYSTQYRKDPIGFLTSRKTYRTTKIDFGVKITFYQPRWTRALFAAVFLGPFFWPQPREEKIMRQKKLKESNS